MEAFIQAGFQKFPRDDDLAAEPTAFDSRYSKGLLCICNGARGAQPNDFEEEMKWR